MVSDMLNLAYKDNPNLRQVVAEIPWGHNLAIINKVKDLSQRQWYAHQTVQNGWSRNVLVHQIESDLYGRQAVTVKTTNFPKTRPSPQSELVEQTIKDPYIFDFITKMNFYLSALDDMVRHPDDQPSVGIILCKTKKGLIAEYSLRDMSKPIGVSEYKLTPKLPKELSGQLPDPRQLARFLKEIEDDLENKKGGGIDERFTFD